jgi:hypothetical protein
VKQLTFFATLLCSASLALAQSQAPPASSPSKSVSRTLQAMRFRQGSNVKVMFQATAQMRGASGEAKLEGKKGTVTVDARFEGLDDATKFGLEYLTYVLWAVSPQGRAESLGELVVEKGNAHLKASTDMQTFGMIVSAEPYFAVTQPGDTVVAESIAPEGMAQGENIETRYELLGRGTYSAANQKIQNAIFGIDRSTPMQLFEARNAVRIAHIAAGEKYAGSILSKADQLLMQAETAYRQKQGKSVIESAARDTTQTAEEARVMAVKQRAEDEAQAKAAAEKNAAEAREAQARADAEAEAKRRAEAEQAQKEAEEAKAAAEEAKAAAEASGKRKARAARTLTAATQHHLGHPRYRARFDC